MIPLRIIPSALNEDMPLFELLRDMDIHCDRENFRIRILKLLPPNSL